MGHLRLGNLPRTRPWQQVVELVASGAEVGGIAAATMRAAQRGLSAGAKDPGLVHSLWLLTQIPRAARRDDFAKGLRSIGLSVSSDPGLFEIAGAFTAAVDGQIRRTGGRTDLGEIAQLAAVESLTSIAGARSRTLFGTTPADVRGALKGLSRKEDFSYLAKEFFARLTRRYLASFLSRELSNHVGGERRFANVAEHAAFNQALERHCSEAATIVETFAGGWFSKKGFETGITREDAGRFAHVALTKLREELTRGAREDG